MAALLGPPPDPFLAGTSVDEDAGAVTMTVWPPIVTTDGVADVVGEALEMLEVVVSLELPDVPTLFDVPVR